MVNDCFQNKHSAEIGHYGQTLINPACMIQVKLHEAGKRYFRKWILKDLNLTFEPSGKYAIVGKNGSGKTTLVKMLAGYLSASAGSVAWSKNGRPVKPEMIYNEVSIAAPYLDLIEEYNVPEMIGFHKQFKAFPENLSMQDILTKLNLPGIIHTKIKDLSSGMKQRVKLILAILPVTKLLLLDEPCTNLDQESVIWYQKLLHSQCTDKTVIVASNHHPGEYPGNFSVISL